VLVVGNKLDLQDRKTDPNFDCMKDFGLDCVYLTSAKRSSGDYAVLEPFFDQVIERRFYRTADRKPANSQLSRRSYSPAVRTVEMNTTITNTALPATSDMSTARNSAASPALARILNFSPHNSNNSSGKREQMLHSDAPSSSNSNTSSKYAQHHHSASVDNQNYPVTTSLDQFLAGNFSSNSSTQHKAANIGNNAAKSNSSRFS
jgi:hypothetical protein